MLTPPKTPALLQKDRRLDPNRREAGTVQPQYCGGIAAASSAMPVESARSVYDARAEALRLVQQASAPGAGLKDAPQGVAHRLLIVDDNRDCADSLRDVLSLSSDWTIDVVYAAREALDKAARDPPDAILLDLEMPGLDGFETASALSEVLPAPCPLLVALTGSDTMMRRAASDPRFTYAFMKPMSQLSLLALLHGLREIGDKVPG